MIFLQLLKELLQELEIRIMIILKLSFMTIDIKALLLLPDAVLFSQSYVVLMVFLIPSAQEHKM